MADKLNTPGVAAPKDGILKSFVLFRCSYSAMFQEISYFVFLTAYGYFPRFEPHQRHCVVSLSKTLYLLLSTGSTQEGPSRHDWKKCWLGRKESNQTNKYFPYWNMFKSLHRVCFMHGLSIYEIKTIRHIAQFFKISYGSFQHLTNLLNKWKNSLSP